VPPGNKPGSAPVLCCGDAKGHCRCRSGFGMTRWLLSIVRRAASAWMAKNRPKDVVLSNALEEADPGTEPALETEPSAATELVMSAKVRALPLRFRAFIVLAEIENLSDREIEEILEILNLR